MFAISGREEIVEAFDALEADLDRVVGVSFEVLTTPERLGLLARLERVRCRLPVVEHGLLNQLAGQASPVSWAGHCRTRWLIGCASRVLRPTAASARPPISGSAAH